MEEPLLQQLVRARKRITEIPDYEYFNYIVIASTLLTMIVVALLLTAVRPHMIPPGPRLLPVLGNLTTMIGQNPRQLSLDLRAKYGDVFSLYFGPRLVVVVTGARLLKEVFIKNASSFSHRPHGLGYERFTNGNGIVNTNGANWKSQRKYTLGCLRQMGGGQEELAPKVMPEVTNMVQVMHETGGQPFNPSKIIGTAIANIVFNICINKRFRKDDPEFDAFYRSMVTIMENNAFSSLLHFLPFLGWIPFDPFNFNWLTKTDIKMKAFIDGQISQRRHHLMTTGAWIRQEQDGVEGEESCFIDSYLKKIQEDAEGERTHFSVENLRQIVLELLLAGTDTTCHTLCWMLLYLALNPHLQEKAHTELDRVLGDRDPLMTDRSLLPYVNAVILETQRLADVVPFSIMHAASKDAFIDGFRIPQSAIVVPCLTSAHHDAQFFPEPMKFSPERFLNVKGGKLMDVGLLPFSLGSRMCLGESLARIELFLITVTLLQHFRFELPKEEVPTCLNGVIGATRRPHPYRIKALPRRTQ